jgi:hypothetical protein
MGRIMGDDRVGSYWFCGDREIYIYFEDVCCFLF